MEVDILMVVFRLSFNLSWFVVIGPDCFHPYNKP